MARLPPPLSVPPLRDMRRRRLILRNRRRSAYLRARIAARRAERALRQFLDLGQLLEWEQNGSFLVRTPAGRVFEILPDTESNICFLCGPRYESAYTRYDPGDTLCVYACDPERGAVPRADNQLAQKLILECADTERVLLDHARIGYRPEGESQCETPTVSRPS